MSTAMLLDRMKLAHRPTLLYGYLRPALAGGWIARTRPDKPRSPKQRYRITSLGLSALKRVRMEE